MRVGRLCKSLLQKSPTKERIFCKSDHILLMRPMIVRSLLIVATPYACRESFFCKRALQKGGYSHMRISTAKQWSFLEFEILKKSSRYNVYYWKWKNQNFFAIMRKIQCWSPEGGAFWNQKFSKSHLGTCLLLIMENQNFFAIMRKIQCSSPKVGLLEIRNSQKLALYLNLLENHRKAVSAPLFGGRKSSRR